LLVGLKGPRYSQEGRGLRLALHLHAAPVVLESDTEVEVPTELNAQDVEVSLGPLHSGLPLAVEERDLDHRQVRRFGKEIPGLRARAGHSRVAKVGAGDDGELACVRV